jgi:hypothetical protein
MHHGVDVALGLSPVDAVSGGDLGDEMIVALKPAEVVLGELSPSRADVLEYISLGFAEIRKFFRRLPRIEIVHDFISKGLPLPTGGLLAVLLLSISESGRRNVSSL